MMTTESPKKSESSLRRLDSFVPTNFTASIEDEGDQVVGHPLSHEGESGDTRLLPSLLQDKDQKKREDNLDIHALVRRSSLVLIPHVKAPLASTLTPLWKLGLEEIVNLKPHYSHTPDDPGLRNYFSRNFQRYLDKRVFRESDVRDFNTRPLPRPTDHEDVSEDGNTCDARATSEGAFKILRSLPRPWGCSLCTHMNHIDMIRCEACQNKRPSSSAAVRIGNSNSKTSQGTISEEANYPNSSTKVLLPTFFPPDKTSVEATCDLLDRPSTGKERVLKRGLNHNQRGGELHSITPSGQSVETQAMGMNINLAAAARPAKVATSAASKNRKVPREQSSTTSNSSQSSYNTVSSTSYHSWKTHYSVLSIEVHAASNSSDGQRLPDPAVPQDHVCVIACVLDRVETSDSSETVKRVHWMAILLPEGISSQQQHQVITAAKQKDGLIPPDTQVLTACREDELFRFFTEMVRETDPDFLVGYELQYKSLGFLMKRFKHLKRWHPELPDLARELGRTPWTRSREESIALSGASAPEPSLGAIYVEDHDSGIFITGRTVINLWRRMRSELKLMNYSVHTVASHLLHRNIPEFTQEQMHVWFSKIDFQMRTLRHTFRLTRLNLELMEKQDLIRRSSESARLFNIDLWSVLTRGSQFRVEAALLKLAHQEQYIAISPSAHSRDNQRPICQIPLVMEPVSSFYSNPVVVLDFQSLYPSMMINYNLCFSTIQGTLKKALCSPHSMDEQRGAWVYFVSLPRSK